MNELKLRTKGESGKSLSNRDWKPVLLLFHNYLLHSAILKRGILAQKAANLVVRSPYQLVLPEILISVQMKKVIIRIHKTSTRCCSDGDVGVYYYGTTIDHRGREQCVLVKRRRCIF